MQDADIAGKATAANAAGSETLTPNLSDGFATEAGAAGFETNGKSTGGRRTRGNINSRCLLEQKQQQVAVTTTNFKAFVYLCSFECFEHYPHFTAVLAPDRRA